MIYIQRKGSYGLETVDQTPSYTEAKRLIEEYQSSDRPAFYYTSQRACRSWHNTPEKKGQTP